MNAPTAAVVLAKALSPDEVAPGWTALLIVVGLGIAVYLLWRSMNNQLRKVPPSFDEPTDPPRDERGAAPPDGSDPGPGPNGQRPAEPR